MNNKETRICQNCKKTFVIEPSDFTFYEKIKVPPPTWCPECRMARRMLWRNERSLYRREDEFGKKIISMYSPDKSFKIYEQSSWWSDDWNPLNYGRDYDWGKSFFEQFNELIKKIPLPHSNNKGNLNCDYCNLAFYSKNCYLSYCCESNENLFYSYRNLNCKDSIDIFGGENNEQCYEIIDCARSYKLFFAAFSTDCLKSAFLYNCHNCQNCFGCVNLRNAKYHIFNKPYSPQDYQKEIKKWDLGSYQKLIESRNKFQKFNLSFPRRFAWIIRSQQVRGDYVSNSKNCYFCFDVKKGGEDSKYITYGFDFKNCYDAHANVVQTELIYEGVSVAEKVQKIFFSVACWVSHDVQYSLMCDGCSSLFGCVGLRNKQYCILNKQYTKEDYEKLVPKIINHMNETPYVDKKGRVYKYGEFFPPELSPFAYNETIAQEYFPLTKKQALDQGYNWKDSEQRNIKPDIKTQDLPDHIKDVKDDIIGKTIQCSHTKIKKDGTLEATCNEQCTTAFKIVPQELQFYRRMNLPLPRLCPNCRHYQRLKQRNPLKLWKRKCQCAGEKSENGVYKNTVKHFHGKKPCPNEFETSYAPDRPEIVYCEQCYLKEVV